MSTSKLDNLLEQLNRIILGNPAATRLAVICLLARGHLLIEDIPGVGKTTLAMPLLTCLACHSSGCNSPATCFQPI